MTISQSAPPAQAQTGSSWVVLRYPKFRWLFFAQLISLIGSSMQLAAVNWHVWNLTQDELALGLVGLVRVIPIIILALLGGVIADAVDRRRLLIFTQSGMLISAGALALATLSGEVSLPIVYLMTAALSGLTAFDNPARSALLPTLVPENQIANAVRLNVVLWQVTAVLGPVVAGLLLAAFGPGLAYGFNALSFLPVVIWALWVRVTPIVSAEKREISFAALGEGLRFVRSTPLLWSSMLLDFFATFFSSALALLPIYATDILRVGAQGYGLLYAAPALGATAGAFLMAQLGSRVKRQGELMIWAVAGYGLSTIIFGLSNSFIISLIALACVGMTDSFSTVVRGALRQLLTPDRLRGRIISITLIFFQGGPQLGEFEAGVMARAFGAPLSVVSGGIGTLIAVGAIAYMVPTLRHYRESAPAEALAVPTTPEPTPQISPP